MNLKNIINSGLNKEMLEMTYPDNYYKNTIQPAKAGTGPMPSKTQMMMKSQPFKAVGMQAANLFNPGKYDAFRAAGTPAARGALSLGKAALGGPYGIAALAGQGIGMAADQYAQATNTPEAYEYMKSMGGANSLGNFDETNLDVGDIYSEMDRLNQPQNLSFRSMVDMNNDAQNFDSQFSYPNRGPVATNIATAPQPKGMSYEQMVDLGLAGPDQDVGMTAGDLQNKQGILQGLQDKMGGLRDFLPGGDKSLSGMAIKGIKGIGNALSGGLGNIFQDRQLYDDTTDEYGNVYSADELNSQNALGGYYTDAARSARRRTSRIANMLSRQKAGKNIGENNLAKLQAQEKIVKQQQQDKQNKIQEAATKRTYSLQDLQNSSDRGTGQNYAAARSRTSSRVSPSGRMRAYGLKDGGLASMFTRRR